MQKNISKDQKGKKKSHAAGDSYNKHTECTPCKSFRYGSEDHLIAKCSNPPKGNEKRQKQVNSNERGNFASQKECDNGNNNNGQNIYASMERMSDNEIFSSRDFGDSSQLTNRILDSGATCHMTPQVSDFIPGSLENTDTNIELRTEITSRRNKKDKY